MATVKIHIAIVAHKDRADAANQLAETVGAQHIAWDRGHRGANANHRAAWLWHQTNPADWSVTLEDDAVPCKDFRRQLTQALTVAPTNICSLYLGRVLQGIGEACLYTGAAAWAIEVAGVHRSARAL